MIQSFVVIFCITSVLLLISYTCMLLCNEIVYMKKINTKPEELLNFVLQVLYAYEKEHYNSPSLPIDGIMQIVEEIETREKENLLSGNYSLLYGILQTLKKDGHIDTNASGTYYYITFGGNLFIDRTGYIIQLQIKSSKARRKKVESILLVGGTTFGGLYGLFEIGKYFLQKDHIEMTLQLENAVLLFACGILTGLAILLVGKEVLNKIQGK